MENNDLGLVYTKGLNALDTPFNLEAVLLFIFKGDHFK